MSPRVVKAISKHIIKPLPTIYIQCFLPDIIPDELKLALVTPVYKANEKELLDHISFLGNRARYGSIEVDISQPSSIDNRSRGTVLDILIPSSIINHSCSVFIHRAPSVIELDNWYSLCHLLYFQLCKEIIGEPSKSSSELAVFPFALSIYIYINPLSTF